MNDSKTPRLGGGHLQKCQSDAGEESLALFDAVQFRFSGKRGMRIDIKEERQVRTQTAGNKGH